MIPLQKILVTAPILALLNGCAVYPKNNYYPNYPGYSRNYAVERNYYPAPAYRNPLVIRRQYYGYPAPSYPSYKNYQPHFHDGDGDDD